MVQLVVGRIGRAHGIRGEVAVEIRTDDPDARFRPGALLGTEPPAAGPLSVDSVRQHGGRLLVSFAGVADRTRAEQLQGTLLVVDVDERETADDPDEFFDHQLIGLAVVTVDGKRLGEVAEVLHLPGQDVLVVQRAVQREARSALETPASTEMLVPFVAAIVPQVDLQGRRLVVDPPDGLLDLPITAGTVDDGPED
jgi:16S rRNA processing protein RimM